MLDLTERLFPPERLDDDCTPLEDRVLELELFRTLDIPLFDLFRFVTPVDRVLFVRVLFVTPFDWLRLDLPVVTALLPELVDVLVRPV